ncbi:MAG TPA: LysR family transcriptional regulator [Candidatus Acidoferrum sp.]|nr:LysR family transcriptional regulator [Candidatus Acidoferrum sp.]
MRHPRLETFDLNLLKIFDALFQHGSVNAAASEIAVSPSAISHALGRLREAFDDDLFVKGPGGMSPTARATEIADRVAAVLLQVRSVLGSEEFDPRKSERHFRVLCNHYAGWLILPYAVRHLLEKAPGITLTVECEYSKSIADELDTGVVDLVIGTFGQMPERLESELLYSDRWVWVLRADHPSLTTELTTERLLQLPQLVIAINEVGRSIDGFVTEAGLERLTVANKMFLGDVAARSRYSAQLKAAMVINSAEVALAILARSDLVALLPERLANTMSRLYKLKIIEFEEKDNVLEHRLVWHRKHGADPATTWLRAVFCASVEEWFSRSDSG